MRRALRLAGITGATLIVLGLFALLANSIQSARVLEEARQDYAEVFGEVSLDELGPDDVHKEDNAATWLVSGSSAIAEISAQASLGRLSRTSTQDWSDSEREQAERILALNKPALDLLARAVTCEASNFGIAYSEGAYARVPDYLALLKAHRLVRVAARVDLTKGDDQGFAERLKLLSSFSEALAREPLVISAMFALDFDSGMLDVIREALADGFGDAAWLSEVHTKLESMNRRDMLWRALAAEGAVAGSMSMATMEQAWGSPVLLRLKRPALRRMQADFLAAPTEAARLIDAPFLQWAESDPDPKGRSFQWAGSPSFHPHMILMIGELQIQETARQLAREAIRLRLAVLESGSYPSDNQLPETEPLTAAPFTRLETSEDGIELAAPRAEEYYRSSSARPDFVYPDLLRWRLPPAGAAQSPAR